MKSLFATCFVLAVAQFASADLLLLCYNPSTGSLTLDTGGDQMAGFDLLTAPGNIFDSQNADFTELPDSPFTEAFPTQLSWASESISEFFTGVANLGNVMPTGLTDAELNSFFDFTPPGQSIVDFDTGPGSFMVKSVPEPSPMLLGLAVLSLVGMSRRAKYYQLLVG